MLTIEILNNKITPFIESDSEYQFIITDETNITSSRSLDLNQKTNNNNSYQFNINMSPALNEITHAQSLLISNYKFNYYVNNIQDENPTNTFNDSQETTLIQKILNQKIIKKTSIKNLKDQSLRGLKEDISFKKHQSPYDQFFHDDIQLYATKTIYNESLGIFEKSTALSLLYDISPVEILYNIWYHFLSDDNPVNDFSNIHSFILKLYYPFDTDFFIFDYSTAILEPFHLRQEIQMKYLHGENIVGLKVNVNQLNNEYSAFLDEYNMSSFNTSTINPNINQFSNISKINKSSILSNGNIKTDNVVNIVNQVNKSSTFLKNMVNLSYSNKADAKITPFVDFLDKESEINDYILKENLYFWNTDGDGIYARSDIFDQYILRMKNTKINSKQYTTISDNSVNSIIYKGMKE